MNALKSRSLTAFSARSMSGLYYLLLAVWSAAGVFVAEGSGIEYLARISIAIPPTFWIIRDVKDRGGGIPHVVQPAVLAFWTYAILVHLVYTRKLKGFGWVLVHVIATVAVSQLMCSGAILCYWGPAAFAL